MIEGVLAVDTEERIITLNEAAGRFLNVDPVAARGNTVYEVIRNTDLQIFIARALTDHGSIEDEITLHAYEHRRFLGLHGTVLRTDRGRKTGAVIVLHDRTHLRQLENVRQLFVANVSHELKTPISAVKAAAETLLDHQRDCPPESAHFLKMITRQADRLGAIVDDLLSLARIEQQSEQDQVELTPHRLGPVLGSAIETCLAKAEAKAITLTLSDSGGDCRVMVNAPLLEQAITNLLDNAIKYCPEGSVVEVKASVSESEAVVEVLDSGPGESARNTCHGSLSGSTAQTKPAAENWVARAWGWRSSNISLLRTAGVSVWKAVREPTTAARSESTCGRPDPIPHPI